MIESGVCPWCYETVSIDMGPAQGYGWEGDCPQCSGTVQLDEAGEWEAAQLCGDELSGQG